MKKTNYPKLCSILGSFVVLMAIVLLAETLGVAQSSPQMANQPGSPAGSYRLGDLDTINLFSGNVNISLPLVGLNGRGQSGGAVSMTIDNQWRLDELSAYQFKLSNHLADSLVAVGHVRVSSTLASTNEACLEDPMYWYVYALRIVVVGPDGTETTLVDPVTKGVQFQQCGYVAYNYGMTFQSTDGSFTTFVSDSNVTGFNGEPLLGVGATGYLFTGDGGKARVQDGKFIWRIDRNGNKTEFTYDSSVGFPDSYPRATQITDSNGRAINIQYDVTESSPYGLCNKITYKGSEGETRVIRVSLGAQIRSAKSGTDDEFNLAEELITTDPADSPQVSGTVHDWSKLPKAVWLPDGRSYEFKYNSNGRIAEIKLPTGGRMEYDFYPSVQAFPNNFDFLYNRVKEKRVYDENNVLQNRTTFVFDLASYGQAGTRTTVSQYDSGNALLSKTLHYFLGQPDSSSFPWADTAGREIKTEILASDGSTVLRRVETTWQYRHSAACFVDVPVYNPCSLPNYSGFPVVAPIAAETINTLVDTNQVSKVTLIDPSTQSLALDENLNPTDIWYYDYGSGQPGSFLRREHTDYVSDSNYVTRYMRTLPSQKWISSDSAGNSKASLTTFEYDNYSTNSTHAGLLSRSNVFGHDSTNFGMGFAYRGNPTAVTAYANAAAQTGAVTSYSQYDILGNVVKTIDANGNASTISYSDNFGTPDSDATTNSTPSQISGYSTFAFPTSSTNPVNWTAYVQYDYFTGNPVNTQDINGIIARSVYNDTLDRPTQSVNAVGTALESQSTIAYDDTNRKVTTTSDLNTLNDNLIKSVSFYDGLGRTTESRTYEADGDYRAVQTQYDALSRPYKQSNPFRPTEIDGSHPILWTTTAFDSLGRVTSITTPDSAVVQTSYYGNATTVTDQAGKVRRSITNAAAQLIRVDEPNSSNQLDVSGSPYQPTSYTYDVLNNLLTVTQASSTSGQCGGASSCSQARTFTYNSLSRLTSATNPESGTISYGYDSNGNLTQKDDARGVRTAFVYDVLNRVTNRNYSTPNGTPSNYQATPNVSYTYDDTNISNSKGRLTKVYASVSTTEYTSFDILGRVTVHKQTTDGNEYTTGYTYKLSGALDEQTYPSGRVVKNELDASGDLSLVTSKENSSAIYKTYANDFTYTAAGAISSLKLGNGRFESTQFNNRLQPTQIALGSSVGNAGLLKIDYTYNTTGNADNNGNVLSQMITVPGLSHPFVQTYTYDELNRLKSATETNNSTQTWKQTFTFDRYGNRRFDEANTTMPTSFSNQALTNPTISTSNNRLTSTGWTYDSAGNTIGDPDGRSFIYDAENKQVEVKNSSNASIGTYFFDGDGRRVKKYVPSTGETTIFVYDAAGKQIAEYSTIVANSTDAKVNYLTADHLGSPRINTDVTGAVTARHDYHPFGEEVTASRTQAEYTPDTVRKQFTGYERDGETDLDFAQARTYGKNLGRYYSVDPYKIVAEVQQQKDAKKAKKMLDNYILKPTRWNRYIYVQNNPLIFVDPSGEVEVLTGSAADQKRALQRLRAELGEERWRYVKVGKACVQGCSGSGASKSDVTILAIDESDYKAFSQIGGNSDEKAYSAGMGFILKSSRIVEFRIADTDSLGESVAASGGGVTIPAEASPSGNIQIFVSNNAVRDANAAFQAMPNQGKDISSDRNPLRFGSVYEIDAHEHGHAADRLRGINTDGSVDSENALRRRGNRTQLRMAEQ